MSDLTTLQIDKETFAKLEAIAERNNWSKQDQIRHWCEMDNVLRTAYTAALASPNPEVLAAQISAVQNQQA